jgi:antitoxin component of MazEF toxin-antitoxin module
MVMEMPVKFTLKIGKVGNSLKVTIPEQIAEHLSLEKGDTVTMWADNSHVIIEKKA